MLIAINHTEEYTLEPTESLCGDRTKCPRTECTRLKVTRIRVKVKFEIKFRVRAAEIMH